MEAIASDWRQVGLDEADTAMCEFAIKLTHEQCKVEEADLDALRAVGFDDRAIHDMVQVIALFNYYPRIAHGLGVEPETFLRAWGKA